MTSSLRMQNQISNEIKQLWIYQNKGIDQARKEVFSRHDPKDVADFLESEREDAADMAAASDTEGTY